MLDTEVITGASDAMSPLSILNLQQDKNQMFVLVVNKVIALTFSLKFLSDPFCYKNRSKLHPTQAGQFLKFEKNKE
eukprot:snap_masked-scaffold_3-processed-gene-21.67-mRNA-1 protein AED:1.00 eAED:1.00 QI:0/0/0/0/1/1/2/0/75